MAKSNAGSRTAHRPPKSPVRMHVNLSNRSAACVGAVSGGVVPEASGGKSRIPPRSTEVLVTPVSKYECFCTDWYIPDGKVIADVGSV